MEHFVNFLSCLPRWCGPCKILGPRLEKMVAKQRGKVVMAKVDIDDHTDLAIEYEVGVGGVALGSQCGHPRVLPCSQATVLVHPAVCQAGVILADQRVLVPSSSWYVGREQGEHVSVGREALRGGGGTLSWGRARQGTLHLRPPEQQCGGCQEGRAGGQHAQDLRQSSAAHLHRFIEGASDAKFCYSVQRTWS